MSSSKQQVYKASDTSLHSGKYYYFVETRQKVPGQTIYDKDSKKQIPNPNFNLSDYDVVDKPPARRRNTPSSSVNPTETTIHHKFTAPQLNDALSNFPDIHVSTVARAYFRRNSSSIQDVINKITSIRQENPSVNFISYSPTKNQLLLSHRNLNYNIPTPEQ